MESLKDYDKFESRFKRVDRKVGSFYLVIFFSGMYFFMILIDDNRSLKIQSIFWNKYSMKLNASIVRLEPYFAEIYKSSLIKKGLEQNSNQPTNISIHETNATQATGL